MTYTPRLSWWERHGWHTLAAVALTALGFAGGWMLAPARPSLPQPPVLRPNPSAAQWDLPGLTSAEQAALDEAFAALKQGHYSEAEKRFNALLKQQPLWTSLGSDLACLAAYRRDEPRLQSLMTQGQHDGSLLAADGKGLRAIYLTKPGTFPAANALFAEAAAADPSRADLFDQWGDCLLRWGKPAEAVGKYRSALLRSNFPVMDDLYEAKVLLAQVQAGQDAPGSELARRLDRALAAPEPSAAALFAGAARAVRAERFPDAAALLERARHAVGPALFRALLFHPAFTAERDRPELAPLFLATEQAHRDSVLLQGEP